MRHSCQSVGLSGKPRTFVGFGVNVPRDQTRVKKCAGFPFRCSISRQRESRYTMMVLAENNDNFRGGLIRL